MNKIANETAPQPSDPDDVLLLALITTDKLAPQVLAAWKALALALESVNQATLIGDLIEEPIESVRSTINRLKAARVLRDGDISPLAQQWLKSLIAKEFAQSKKQA